MPELPEVETVRRQVGPQLLGRTVTRARVDWPRLVRAPGRAALVRDITGLTFGPVGRRGKHLLFALGADRVLVAHLGMSGSFRVFEAGAPGPRHVLACFSLDDGRELAYVDPRRFGRMRLGALAALERMPELAGLGPDPLESDFTPARLARILGGTRRLLRECLLDQHRVAGLGNIYVAEALFRARLDPHAPASAVDDAGIRRLHRGIRGVLEGAIRWKGSTILSYRDSEGNRGGFAGRLAVYGRDGEPCRRCRTPIVREVRNGRSSYFCPSCQPPLRSPPGRARTAAAPRGARGRRPSRSPASPGSPGARRVPRRRGAPGR